MRVVTVISGPFPNRHFISPVTLTGTCSIECSIEFSLLTSTDELLLEVIYSLLRDGLWLLIRTFLDPILLKTTCRALINLKCRSLKLIPTHFSLRIKTAQFCCFRTREQRLQLKLNLSYWAQKMSLNTYLQNKNNWKLLFYSNDWLKYCLCLSL
jgi:hypothetical protein